MSKVEDFLSKKEEEEIIEAIRQAESKTSGEIRVHLEASSKIDTYERALELFHLLKMDNTKLQNGVLIYVAVHDRTFVICGDKDINDVVSHDFWDTTKNVMQTHFKQGQFKQGLIAGILTAGTALSEHFPWEHGDQNELPNTISKG